MDSDTWSNEKDREDNLVMVEPVELAPPTVTTEGAQHAHNAIRTEPSYSTIGSSEKHEKEYLQKREDSMEESCTSNTGIPELSTEWEDDSPYPEVRATVPNTDDPTMPTNTFRMWFIGIISTAILSIFNTFFGFRYPSVGIPLILVELLALPIGRFMAQVLPEKQFRIFGQTFTLNPGPFNIKEHALIALMASFGGGAYALDITSTQRVFYNQNWGVLYELCLVISTQFIGYGFAGVCRRYLVWPPSMIWPGNLVTVSFFTSMHEPSGTSSNGKMNRWKFFLIAMACSALYYWFPGYVFQALSIFNWVCWIAPDNFVVNSLFGYTSGFGMSLLTFDWNQITYAIAPLYTPWWAQANAFVAFVLIFWIIAPICYYSNVFYSAYLPVSAVYAFDNTGNEYAAAAIMANGTFNEQMYEEYSPLYMTITFALDYGISFAALTAVLVHAALWHGHDFVRQLRTSLSEEGDVHSRLMAVYREVPDWWYILLGLVSFGLALVTTLVWPTELPVWGLILALIVSLVYLLPTGIILAISNFDITMNVMAELIGGYLLPGKPVANMMFKTFGLMTNQQALGFVADLKLGHYMKIPPRMMFVTQIVATLIAGVLCVLVQDWMFVNVDGLCTATQADNFTCPGIEIFGAASLIYGTIGPARFFATGLYSPLLWCFLIGAVLSLVCYLLAKRYPNSVFKWINIPLALYGAEGMPPASGFNYVSGFLVGTIFMYYIRRYHVEWWSRYNYLLSVALDSGVAISALLIYLIMYLPSTPIVLVGTSLITANWWGNTVSSNNLDAMYASWKTINPGETFGLTSW
ncbi:OPT oligopeptide transporter [Calocera cornea HHB12733]|uniref:OPT oligopeptide transporter n=1 Tax=Calocera cornea HHB12733 TaxID=1353952 RepID=A0A165GMF0_9BASI|nr:OPT oligopeptide transporter [Calocera cornea HHB12733]